VISEVPDEWNEFLLEWDRLAFSVIRDVDGQLAPDAVERYLLLQTLVGTWPRSLEDAAWKKYCDRISEYMTKAMREAKRNTSWLDPSPDYEAAVTSFVVEALDQGRSPRLISLVDSFVQRIAQAGYWNSLSQLALKATLPGVPDFYQGTEFWDFSLVDPDNRRPVDFDERQRMLNEMLAEYKMDPAAYVLRFENDWSHSPIKLFATWQLLSMRQQFSELFANGSYLPLEVGGEFATHIIAFARLRERESVLVVVPRCIQRLLQDAGQSHINWRDTFVRVPNGLGKSFCSLTAGSSKELVLDCKLKVSIALKSFPFAVLLSE
jgi:(1->4)-alpha-D-glucan 1-alpha-D-glucosylmutase